jgi:hypothetical protein
LLRVIAIAALVACKIVVDLAGEVAQRDLRRLTRRRSSATRNVYRYDYL